MTAASVFLVGIDGSEQALDAARVSAALAQARGAGVLLASVYTDDPADDAGRARERVDAVDVADAGRAVHAAPDLEVGLDELAERESAALIALGAGRRYGIGRLKPDGVVERMLHRARRPVLVAGDDVRDARAPVRAIGVAHAGDQEGDAALAVGAALAGPLGAALRLVGAAEPGDRDVEALAGERARDLGRRAGQHGTVAAEPRVRAGHPAPVLLREADALDLLILGSGRNAAPGRVALGGVSRRVVAHARCPVLVVPRSG